MGNDHGSHWIMNSRVNLRGGTAEVDPIISGLAIPYDKWTRINTKDGGMYLERIQRGALKDTLATGGDIYCAVDHNENAILGDTRSNLTLYDRDDGLHFELKANNQRARQMVDGIRSGFFDKCSFMFRKLDWKDEEQAGLIWRTINKIELYEISLLNDPAYVQTNAEVKGSGGSDYRGSGSLRRTMASIPGIQFR